MDDYIRKQDAVDMCGGYGCLAHLMSTIKPVDVAKVVRCEYCKHHIVSKQGRLYCIRGFEQTLFSAFSAIDNPIFERELDSFCSYGERREESDNG